MQGLKIAVIVMSVLIVAGVAVIGVTIARRVYVAPGPLAEMLLDEPAGTHIVAVSGPPQQLLVQLQGGGPDRVVMVDMRDGKIAGRLSLKH